jgi:general secretion pathway protein C
MIMAAMTARWWAFGVWALVAACAAYWGLRLFAPGRAVPPEAVVAPTGASPRGDLARLLGADPVPQTEEAAPAPTNARFQLLGVVAPRHDPASREGVALIAVDGKPPRAYRVGAAVEGETVLQSVRARGASLGPRGGVVQVSLEIPPPPAAATGTLPPAGGAPGGPPPVVQAPVVSPPPGLPNLAAPQGATTPRPPVVVPLPGRGPLAPSRSVASPPVDVPAPPPPGQSPVVQQVQ